MSLFATNTVNLSQAALRYLAPVESLDDSNREYPTFGGVLSKSEFAWLASGPRLQVLDTKTGNKVGAWTFGWVTKESDTEIVCVEEICDAQGRFPLLAVGLDCAFKGGLICIFEITGSKVVRAIQLMEKVTSLHVIDSGCDVFTLPGVLRNFDGVLAVGTAGGEVFLIDICRQACDEVLTVEGCLDVRDELNPCQVALKTCKDAARIEEYKEMAVFSNQHLALHLNVIFNKTTPHFTLRGPQGDDRLHVNKAEVIVSSLYYCPQLGSLLVGYNFGAFQVYSLITMDLIFTSPVCEEHVPISHFAVQEPADDPRAFCYVWVMFSDQLQGSLPLAAMYAFCYTAKEYHEGYGHLYQDFQYAKVQYQMELGPLPDNRRRPKPTVGSCLKLEAMGNPACRGLPHHDSENNSTLCIFAWNVHHSDTNIETFTAVFDLNQWYKEQMPKAPGFDLSPTYLLKICISTLVESTTNKNTQILDVYINKNSIHRFVGTQRLEEHFCPSSLTFDLLTLRDCDVLFLRNFGVQKSLLTQIEAAGPQCLIEPAEIYQKVVELGLTPLFIDLQLDTPVSTSQQREIVLAAALEHHLTGWLCKCASEWANGSCSAAGCSLDLLISWLFHRAAVLKQNCDNLCIPLFDYSEARLDANMTALVDNCIRQLKSIYSFYNFVATRLMAYVSNAELVTEQYRSLQTVSIYYEVLQWFLNVGLLPECPLSTYPRPDEMDRISAPYPAQMLVEFYNHRRATLKIESEKAFSSPLSVLYIDNLVEKECGTLLITQWTSDGGNGMYPPPSIQSLLRTYLIDTVPLSHKHSVVTYLLLDLAMMLDPNRYNLVITHLIKFPTVFNVSPSHIKITQAFWQLDHEDFDAAMGLLLDPMIRSNDLTTWHHEVALRSLYLQKQYHASLLYIQVRQPKVVEDDDILMVISLYVGNNMLDKAFYFEKQFANRPDRNKFLLHLFKECIEKDALMSIMHRSFSPQEEALLLKFLTDCKKPEIDDLIVYYHVLRSHYLEAFDHFGAVSSSHPDGQGLRGQETAQSRNQLIYGLMKLLPDVSRNLLSYVNQERATAWKLVSRPTPMSVTIYNMQGNVRYKSSAIAAAMTKAKETFNESFIKRKFETETTPFLRTPIVDPSISRSTGRVIRPRIIEQVDEDDEEEAGPTPPKRPKLSPRISGTPQISSSVPSKLETPLVRRRPSTASLNAEQSYENICTPHSILKIRKLLDISAENSIQVGESREPSRLEEIGATPVKPVGKKLDLSPRKSLVRTPSVRFEELKASSPAKSRRKSKRNFAETEASISSSREDSPNVSSSSIGLRQSTPSESHTVSETPKSTVKSDRHESMLSVTEVRQSTSISAEDQDFYSAETSPEVSPEKEEISKTLEDSKTAEAEEAEESPRLFSPRARKSYKHLSDEATPLRSSPRLSQTKAEATPKASPKAKETPPPSPRQQETRSSPRTPVPRARKSLCRQVLEHNALSQALTAPLASASSPRTPTPTTRTPTATTTPVQQHQQESVQESVQETVIESTKKFADGEERCLESIVERHSLTTKTSLLASDLDRSVDGSDAQADAGAVESRSSKLSTPERCRVVEGTGLSEGVTSSITPRRSLLDSSVQGGVRNIPAARSVLTESMWKFLDSTSSSRDDTVDDKSETAVAGTGSKQETTRGKTPPITPQKNYPTPRPILSESARKFLDSDDDNKEEEEEEDDSSFTNETDESPCATSSPGPDFRPSPSRVTLRKRRPLVRPEPEGSSAPTSFVEEAWTTQREVGTVADKVQSKPSEAEVTTENLPASGLHSAAASAANNEPIVTQDDDGVPQFQLSETLWKFLNETVSTVDEDTGEVVKYLTPPKEATENTPDKTVDEPEMAAKHDSEPTVDTLPTVVVEAMEVDDDGNDEVVQAEQLAVEHQSESDPLAENDQENEPSSSTTTRLLDLEMNVFEVPEELTINRGTEVVKEVSLGDDLYSDRTDGFLSTMQEDVFNTATLDVLNKRDLQEGASSEDDPEEAFTSSEKQPIVEKPNVDEVIEISSSSEPSRYSGSPSSERSLSLEAGHDFSGDSRSSGGSEKVQFDELNDSDDEHEEEVSRREEYRAVVFDDDYGGSDDDDDDDEVSEDSEGALKIVYEDLDDDLEIVEEEGPKKSDLVEAEVKEKTEKVKTITEEVEEISEAAVTEAIVVSVPADKRESKQAYDPEVEMKTDEIDATVSTLLAEMLTEVCKEVETQQAQTKATEEAESKSAEQETQHVPEEAEMKAEQFESRPEVASREKTKVLNTSEVSKEADKETEVQMEAECSTDHAKTPGPESSKPEGVDAPTPAEKVEQSDKCEETAVAESCVSDAKMESADVEEQAEVSEAGLKIDTAEEPQEGTEASLQTGETSGQKCDAEIGEAVAATEDPESQLTVFRILNKSYEAPGEQKRPAEIEEDMEEPPAEEPTGASAPETAPVDIETDLAEPNQQAESEETREPPPHAPPAIPTPEVVPRRYMHVIELPAVMNDEPIDLDTFVKTVPSFLISDDSSDALDVAAPSTSRGRSSSVSSASGRPRSKVVAVDAAVTEEALTPRRSSRKRTLQTSDGADVMDVTHPVAAFVETLESGDLTPSKVRTRRSSSDAVVQSMSNTTTTATSQRKLRTRSGSMDESRASLKVNAGSTTTTAAPSTISAKRPAKKGARKASSLHPLPIVEEEQVEDAKDSAVKKAQSAIEGYSMARRMTRRQMNMLQKTMGRQEGTPMQIEDLDPIVLLDRVPFEGPADPEEKKVYETSPSSTLSVSSATAIRPGKRLRSASQTSDVSVKSKSSQTTPEKVKKSPYKEGDKSDLESSPVPRATRSRSRSVSSNVSTKSNVSRSSKVGRKPRQVARELTDIKEVKESEDIDEVKKAPARRTTRKTSSQK